MSSRRPRAHSQKSHPKTLLVLLISASGGMILGLMMGHLRDLTDRVFRTRDQVERFLGLDCLATVPKIKVNRVKGVPSSASSTKVVMSKGAPTASPKFAACRKPQPG